MIFSQIPYVNKIQKKFPKNDRVGTNDRVRELCLDENLIWDAPWVVGRLRAWLSGEELVVESNFETALIRRPAD